MLHNICFKSRDTFIFSRAEISIALSGTFIMRTSVSRIFIYALLHAHCDMCNILWVWHVIPAYVTVCVYVARERIQTYYPISAFIRVSASHVRVTHPRLLPGGFITCCPSVCVSQHPTVVPQYRSVARSGFNQVF